MNTEMKEGAESVAMTPQSSDSDTQSLSEDNHFYIGGKDFFDSKQASSNAPNQDGYSKNDAVANIQIRIGTLLKMENVSFLLGAGASADSGGLTIGSVPLEIEQALHEEGISGSEPPRIRRWLKVFYEAMRSESSNSNIPRTRDEILKRRKKIADQNEKDDGLQVNLEQVLAILHRWRASMPNGTDRLRLIGATKIDVKGDELDDCIAQVTQALARHCFLPTSEKQDGFSAFKAFVRKLLTRPLNLKRVNIFTLNYDTLVEQAADAEGIVLLDGFVGTTRRIFRPESFEQDLYFPAETTEGRVHRFDRVLHLYKLHGSITWVAESPEIDNPYGIVAQDTKRHKVQHPRRLLVYPTPSKVGETLGMPYAEMFRRFAVTVARPQSALFIIGYGFGDEHVNAVIRQAMAIPSFTLVIVDPTPKSRFVEALRKQQDCRVWIAEGPKAGRFSWFVNRFLPDLRDEDINKKVQKTCRALSSLDSVDEK